MLLISIFRWEYKWLFCLETKTKWGGEKARLVAPVFFEETRHLCSRYKWNNVSMMKVIGNWQYRFTWLMYVVTTYSHVSLSLDLYIEIIEELNILDIKVNCNMCVWNFWSHLWLEVVGENCALQPTVWVLPR
jgi:hypothetical protein